MCKILFLSQAGALVNIYTDGSVLLTHGGTEMGQGLHTKMLQVQISQNMKCLKVSGHPSKYEVKLSNVTLGGKQSTSC